MKLLLDINKFLPITILITVLLFMIKEILERLRRADERRRKTKALQMLISHEIEKNNWALESFFRILSSIKENLDNNVKAKYSLELARNGAEHYRIEIDDDDWSGGAVPSFHFSVYEKVITQVAELNIEMYETLSNFYNELYELNHYRNTLLEFLDDYGDFPPRELTEVFLGDLSLESKKYFEKMYSSYRLLTGEELKKARVR